jgi:hypothetical protein
MIPAQAKAVYESLNALCGTSPKNRAKTALPAHPHPLLRAQQRHHRAEATRVQLGAGRRCASAATAAIGGWDAHETVGPPASAVVSLSMLTKTAPTPRRVRRARARNLRTEEGPQINGAGDTGGRRLVCHIAGRQRARVRGRSAAAQKAQCPSRPPPGRLGASRITTAQRTRRRPLRLRWGILARRLSSARCDRERWHRPWPGQTGDAV